MDFEWDEDKRDSNLEKHGIDFVAATAVFEDPNAIETYDAEHSDDEDRYQIIGEAAPGVLFVVYTLRGEDEDVIRIISARRASRREIARYRSMFGGA